MSEQNKAVVRRTLEIYTRGNLDLIDEIYAPDFIDRSPGAPPGMAEGRQGVKQFASLMRNAFPDLSGEIEELIGEGDHIALRWAARGTHHGDFLGVPPTGRQVSFSGTSIYRLTGGQIAEEWTHADLFGLMTQLGVVPEMALTA